MTERLKKAMAEENAYISDRINGIDTNLQERLIQYDYISLNEYFQDKKIALFNEWIPEVRRTHISIVSDVVAEAIKNEDYGVYIPTVEGKYAFHGNDDIDKELCKTLNIRPVNMGYRGGIIIGSDKDFAIEILMPASLGVKGNEIITKFAEIMKKYVQDVTIDKNDILISEEKVMGSMERYVGKVYVWAAQVSFGDYTEEIAQICKKHSGKKPGKIDNNLLNRAAFE